MLSRWIIFYCMWEAELWYDLREAATLQTQYWTPRVFITPPGCVLSLCPEIGFENTQLKTVQLLGLWSESSSR